VRKHFTSREAAKRIGVTPQTLYTWIARGLVKAPEQIRAGGATFRLWTEDDIAAARKAKGKLKRGPKPQGGSHAS
jgi:DNA-binding transcriptional MerR regulator